MRPLSAALSVKPRVYKTVQSRPITESGIESFRQWIENHRWMEVYTCTDANEKAEHFQKVVTENFLRCFPVKVVKFSEDDQPWTSQKVKKLDRLRKREFYKNKNSAKWIKLNAEFEELCKHEKENIILILSVT